MVSEKKILKETLRKDGHQVIAIVHMTLESGELIKMSWYCCFDHLNIAKIC